MAEASSAQEALLEYARQTTAKTDVEPVTDPAPNRPAPAVASPPPTNINPDTAAKDTSITAPQALLFGLSVLGGRGNMISRLSQGFGALGLMAEEQGKRKKQEFENKLQLERVEREKEASERGKSATEEQQRANLARERTARAGVNIQRDALRIQAFGKLASLDQTKTHSERTIKGKLVGYMASLRKDWNNAILMGQTQQTFAEYSRADLQNMREQFPFTQSYITKYVENVDKNPPVAKKVVEVKEKTELEKELHARIREPTLAEPLKQDVLSRVKDAIGESVSGVLTSMGIVDEEEPSTVVEGLDTSKAPSAAATEPSPLITTQVEYDLLAEGAPYYAKGDDQTKPATRFKKGAQQITAGPRP